jgi:hypothetical protein
MTALSIQPTYPIFTDIDGQPLEDGYVWIGVANLQPIGNPINVYWDAALTLPAAQPIRTRGGYPANSGTPARLYVNSDYSIQVQNKNGSVVYSAAEATERYSDAVISKVSAGQIDFAHDVAYPAGTVGSALLPIINVQNAPFNAVGDGVTDDTTAIADAILSLPATGGTIYFPKGTYITDPIVLPVYPKCINFTGDGREVSLLKPRLQNQKLIESAGITPGIGGTRFQMRHMGMVPHASGSTGMAVDMRNMNYAIIDDFAFVQNGSATFDIGFELFSQDLPFSIGCYYNTFRDVNVSTTELGGTLPVKQVFKIFGASGNHIIDHLTVSGAWPTTTRPAISIDTYCRHNIVMNSNFEGLGLTGTNTVISDNGYGNYHFNNYFELTGQPYYFAAEVETGSREWCVVEKNAFAAGTLDGTSNSLVNGSTWRDNYAFGTDATVLAAIQLEQYNTRSRFKQQQLLISLASTAPWKTRLSMSNTENAELSINADENGDYIESFGSAYVAVQGSATGGFVSFSCAPAGTAGNPITFRNPAYFSYAGDTTGYNGANAAGYVNKNAVTSRSINAAGTVNASGTDYAEYMTKAGDFILEKGDICGVNADGKLTNVFGDAVSFVVKSTSPSYVGGDGWFTEEQPKDDLIALAAWEDRYQAARAQVDRVAFAGQVPVNVLGAVPGQYIIPVNDGGKIKGSAVSNPTFEQYQIAVGKIIAIEDDGRARIIVKVA